ncbi:MAG: TIGR01244 family phosphatase [Rhodobacteraceae bacterium]|nr:TIGR01244 family phosphatase [Paracoccaceae bacterium]
MVIRPLTSDYAVSPQIDTADLPAIKAAGYTTVICNRPDEEVPPSHFSSTMQAAAEAAGLKFAVVPISAREMTLETVDAHRAALDGSEGPVLAYCASGNRSSIVWALANAGRVPTDDLIAAGAKHGYQLAQFRELIERLAQG